MKKLEVVITLIAVIGAYFAVGHHTSFFSRNHGGNLGGYGNFHSFGTTNRSVLCALKSGTCVTTTTSCVGTLKFSCENSALCCFNTTTTVSYVVKSFRLGGGYGRRRRFHYGPRGGYRSRSRGRSRSRYGWG